VAPLSSDGNSEAIGKSPVASHLQLAFSLSDGLSVHLLEKWEIFWIDRGFPCL
jgi:hypothetical protein